jgi:Ternary complex associated domain 9
MPIDYERTVLLGDNDPERSALLVDIIANEFRTRIIRAEFFDEVDARVFEAVRSYVSWKLVLLSAELKESAKKWSTIVPNHFFLIAKNNGFNVACVHTEAQPPDSDAVGSYIPSIYIPPAATDNRRKSIIDNIAAARIAGLAPRKRPVIKLDKDPVLAEQVNGLSVTEDSQKAEEVLAYLIGDFQTDKSAAVAVSKLIQGASGSKVFCFRPEVTDPSVNERVIKIAHYSHEWKLVEEVEKHITAQRSLNNGYKGHVPDIESFASGTDRQHITSYGDWRAIAYDFLGGAKFGKGLNRFGKFMDLETALIGSQEELQRKMADTHFEGYFASPELSTDGRRRFLELLLDWLSNNWYLAHSRREEKVIWDYSNGSDNSFDGFPPYRIPGRSKRYIINFLDSRTAQMGSRFFDKWEEHHQMVRTFVAGSEAQLNSMYTLTAPQRVILSPAHGDLNSNNILLWLDEVEHPFLIDFPLYQESGHALQDFARLEVEVKFTLMDRQADSSPKELPAFDYTHSQVRLWQELERHSLRETWDASALSLEGGAFDKNVILSHDLVNLIRIKARAVQEQHQSSGTIAFWTEYKPALLYHTLRAIGYDTLSPFKRILAVSSAAQLLAQCRNGASFS